MCGNTKSSDIQNNHLFFVFFRKMEPILGALIVPTVPQGFPYIFVSAPRSPRICFMPNRWGKSSSHLSAFAEKRRPSSLSSSMESDVGLPGTFGWIFFVVYLFECSQSRAKPARHNFGNREEKEYNSRFTLRILDSAGHVPHSGIGNRLTFLHFHTLTRVFVWLRLTGLFCVFFNTTALKKLPQSEVEIF